MNQNVESFQPIEGNDYITRKYDIIDDLVDNEPEIITADPNAEEVRTLIEDHGRLGIYSYYLSADLCIHRHPQESGPIWTNRG